MIKVVATTADYSAESAGQHSGSQGCGYPSIYIDVPRLLYALKYTRAGFANGFEEENSDQLFVQNQVPHNVTFEMRNGFIGTGLEAQTLTKP